MAMWDLPLPAGATLPPWDHGEVNWNPQGHPPPVYQVPHFDFHFYTIPMSTQMAIVGGPDTTTVPAQYVPQDYQSQEIAVPAMGTHWVDTLAAELHGQPFDHTFIYGFYQGQMAFLEPMVTLAYLQSEPDATMPVKQPQAFQQSGSYPRAYSVKWDATNQSVRITLDSLTAH
jgi:hypothetical protein